MPLATVLGSRDSHSTGQLFACGPLFLFFLGGFWDKLLGVFFAFFALEMLNLKTIFEKFGMKQSPVYWSNSGEQLGVALLADGRVQGGL